MDLKELLQTLKTASTTLEDFVNSTESMCGQDFADKYVKDNHFEYIEPEIKKAIHAGFIFALEWVKNRKMEVEKNG